MCNEMTCWTISLGDCLEKLLFMTSISSLFSAHVEFDLA